MDGSIDPFEVWHLAQIAMRQWGTRSAGIVGGFANGSLRDGELYQAIVWRDVSRYIELMQSPTGRRH